MTDEHDITGEGAEAVDAPLVTADAAPAEAAPADASAPAGEPAAESGQRAKRRGFYLTPRQAFLWLAVVLLALLLGLLAYLLFFKPKPGLITRGGQVRAGIEPLFVIDGPGTGAKPRFSRPMGAAFAPDGRIYVADTGNNRVCVFDAEGGFLFEFGGFGIAKPLPGIKATWKPGLLNYPIGVAVAADGTVYVADFRNDQVQAFKPDGTPVLAFPDPKRPTGKGSSGQDGGGIAATAVAVRDGKVYVTDQWQVFVFDTKGKLLAQFGKPGTGPSDMDHPNGVAVGPDGTVYVSDSNHARVLAFDKSYKLTWGVGEIPSGMQQSTPGTFGLPRGITYTERDTVIVVDAFDFSLAEISTAGKIVGTYGERGVDPGQVNFPNSIDSRGDRIVVTDKENDRVQVLRLVR